MESQLRKEKRATSALQENLVYLVNQVLVDLRVFLGQRAVMDLVLQGPKESKVLLVHKD